MRYWVRWIGYWDGVPREFRYAAPHFAEQWFLALRRNGVAAEWGCDWWTARRTL